MSFDFPFVKLFGNFVITLIQLMKYDQSRRNLITSVEAHWGNSFYVIYKTIAFIAVLMYISNELYLIVIYNIFNCIYAS